MGLESNWEIGDTIEDIHSRLFLGLRLYLPRQFFAMRVWRELCLASSCGAPLAALSTLLVSGRIRLNLKLIFIFLRWKETKGREKHFRYRNLWIGWVQIILDFSAEISSRSSASSGSWIASSITSAGLNSYTGSGAFSHPSITIIFSSMILGNAGDGLAPCDG